MFLQQSQTSVTIPAMFQTGNLTVFRAIRLVGDTAGLERLLHHLYGQLVSGIYNSANKIVEGRSSWIASCCHSLLARFHPAVILGVDVVL